MWLVRRVMVLMLVLAALCAGVVVVARANPEPSRLQALGFGVCDGEPCWRGIKAGMDWNKTEPYVAGKRRRWPNERGVILDDSSGDFVEILLGKSYDNSSISGIVVWPIPEHPQPLTAGEVVTLFGPPCSIFTNQAMMLIMVYPTMTATIEFGYSPIRGPYVSPEMYISEVLTTVGRPDQCVINEAHAPWNGFASYEKYRTWQPEE